MARFSAITIVLCAWCRRYGRAHRAARDVHSRQWQSLSYEAARALEARQVASHGVCQECRALVAKEWGLDN